MNTKKRLITAAGHLLDERGYSAVTLRAVGHAVGLSHNAPYKHFKNRNALLAAVATADFEEFTIKFREVQKSPKKPVKRLLETLAILVNYSHVHPARYRLIFNNPDLVETDPEFARVSSQTFEEFLSIIEACQADGSLPVLPGRELAGLILATLHGLLALESTGQLQPQKGLKDVETSLTLLIKLISSSH